MKTESEIGREFFRIEMAANTIGLQLQWNNVDEKKLKEFWVRICKLGEDIDNIINEVQSLCTDTKENVSDFMDRVAPERKYQRAVDDVLGQVGLKLGYIDSIGMTDDSDEEEDDEIKPSF